MTLFLCAVICFLATTIGAVSGIGGGIHDGIMRRGAS